jgi:hypothetical protein
VVNCSSGYSSSESRLAVKQYLGLRSSFLATYSVCFKAEYHHICVPEELFPGSVVIYSSAERVYQVRLRHYKRKEKCFPSILLPSCCGTGKSVELPSYPTPKFS